MKGHIHSFDTFGTVDGPGVRFVLFMQGCPLQCKYCHNPDTWNACGGKMVTVEDVLTEVEPYLVYYKRHNGGITATGGEATLQASFVADLFRACKNRWDLHTALDTNGFCEPDGVKELIEATDLVLLDLKHIRREEHIALTNQPNDKVLHFAEWLSEKGKPMWIRHVLIPGISDSEKDLTALGQFIGMLKNVQKVEILPYHKMGIYKWERLGKVYSLKDTPTPSEEEVARAFRIVETARTSSSFAGAF